MPVKPTPLFTHSLMHDSVLCMIRPATLPARLVRILAVVELDVIDPRRIEDEDIVSAPNEDTNLVDLTLKLSSVP